MTQHTLQGRSDAEVTWFQRRSFLQAAAAWTAMGALCRPTRKAAATSSNW